MTQICFKCLQELDTDNFYTYKDNTKLIICKNCLTSQINVYDPNTFLQILENIDVPYIKSIWNDLRDRVIEAYNSKNNKEISKQVFGKYLAKMKLFGYKSFGYKDTERFNEYGGKN